MKKTFLFLTIVTVLALGLTPAFASNLHSTDERPAAPSAVITELIVDGSFEACTPSAAPDACPDWGETSSQFGSPICNTGWCGTGGGTAGARTGSIWGWFGGSGGFGAEIATLSQSVTLPECGVATLYFYLWNGTHASASVGDYFEVDVNGNIEFHVDEGDATYAAYTLVTIDMAAYLGSTVVITFTGTDNSGDAIATNFSLDDVSLMHDDSVPCEEPGEEVPAVNYPNRGEILISAGAPVVPYAAPGEYAQAFTLPADYDGNGFDTYVITATATVGGATWYAIWVGGVDYLWVPASQVQTLR